MKYLAIVAAGLVLAGCESMPGMPTVVTGGGGEGAPVDSARQAQFVALVEQSGCRVDPRNHAFVHDAGFTDLVLDPTVPSLDHRPAAGKERVRPCGSRSSTRF